MMTKQAVTRTELKTVAAKDLQAGMQIFAVQFEGERSELKTPAPVMGVWHHGPCVTTLTPRGYVEWDQDEIVRVRVRKGN